MIRDPVTVNKTVGMIIPVLILCALLVCINASFVNKISDLFEWELHKNQFQKSYASQDEEARRMQNFLKNKAFIDNHNELYRNGFTSFELAMNQFGDMNLTEILTFMSGLKVINSPELNKDAITFTLRHNVTVPDEIDWRKKGAVTEVKDQKHCGSCWAFSATGALEAQQFLKSGKLISLSEQNLVDCSQKYGNQGCNGGYMNYAFQYVKDNDGIDTEVSYPYEAEDDKCRYNPKNKGATDTGFVNITFGDENHLKIAVATVGPISAGICSSNLDFTFYRSGVYYHKGCRTDLDGINHAVLIVGYGATLEDEEYWIVKNSWGETWGDNGYILMSRNKQNNCGIASQASYPSE